MKGLRLFGVFEWCGCGFFDGFWFSFQNVVNVVRILLYVLFVIVGCY